MDANVHVVPVALLSLIGVVIVLASLFLYVMSVVWAFSDAEARGKSGILVAIMVMFLFWPMGLLVWVIFRPEELVDRPATTFVQCSCGTQLPVREAMAGMKLTCHRCKAEVPVPELSRFRRIVT